MGCPGGQYGSTNNMVNILKKIGIIIVMPICCFLTGFFGTFCAMFGSIGEIGTRRGGTDEG